MMIPIEADSLLAVALKAIDDVAEGKIYPHFVLSAVLNEGGEIDPYHGAGGIGLVINFPSMGVRGDEISRLYRDVCGESLVNFVAVMRAFQLGLLQGNPLEITDICPILTAVRNRLPLFAAFGPLVTRN